jgi:hypothetical protein
LGFVSAMINPPDSGIDETISHRHALGKLI